MQKTHLLQRISQNTDALRKKMGFSSFVEPPIESPSSSPAFDLPLVPDIRPQLLEAGAPTELARALYRSYHDKANMARQCTLQHISKLVNIPGMADDRVVRLFSNAFQKQLEAWREQTTKCIYAKRFQGHPTGERSRRSPFNAESIPLLESYFKRNAYPSASDRSMLAGWTGMTPRQIEVWFQNHRNRRRNGQSLNRLSEPLPLQDLLDDLTKYSKYSQKARPTPVSEESPTRSPSASRTPPPQRTEPSPLNPPAPRHAFPMPFPPICDYDPFPVKESGQPQLPAFQWMRSPSQPDAPKRRRPSEVSVDEFSDEFATRLNLRRGNNRKRSSDVLESEEPATPWRTPTHVYLCRGRHPALVRSELREIPAPRSFRPPMSSVLSSRPTKRLRSSPPSPSTPLHIPRSRCTSSSSSSSDSSSSTLTTPTNSPVVVPFEFETASCLPSLEIDSWSSLPAQTLCPPAFEPYADSHVTFGLLHHDTHGN